MALQYRDGDGEEKFNFEPYVQEMMQKRNKMAAARKARLGASGNKFDMIVCSHNLQGLCSVGWFDCTYLHQFDKSRMTACKYGDLCKIKNCPLKHHGESEQNECLYYRQGFCMRGPDCKLKHVKRRAEERPEVASFEQCVGGVVTSGGTVSASVTNKLRKSNAQSDNYKTTFCAHWLMEGNCHFNDDCHYAHGEEQINDINQGVETQDDLNIYDPTRLDLSADPVVPFPKTTKVAYFLFQAPDLTSLAVSKRRGVWSVTVRMAATVNAAFKSHEYVVAYMASRTYRGIYGVVLIKGIIPPAQAGSHMTPEFPVKWIRTMRVATRTIAQMKFDTGMFIGKTASDGRFHQDVGYNLLLIMYRKPAWDWSTLVEIEKAQMGIPEEAEIFCRPCDMSAEEGGGPDVLFGNDWVERITSTSIAYDNAQRRNKNIVLQNQYYEAPDKLDLGNDYYTGTNPGFIFVAQTPDILSEMIHRKLFGVPREARLDIVIHTGAPLFVCSRMDNMLFGIFQAETPVSENIDPSAFAYQGGPSMLPIQCRVSVAHECPMIPLNDDELRRKVFRKGPVFGPISLELTKELANIFAKRSGLQIGGMHGATMGQSHGAMHGRGSGAPGPGMVTSMYKPPFKHIEEVPVDIAAELHQVKRRILGNNASTVKGIIEEIGDRHSVRIRMRGIGSGYPEGPEAIEYQVPLHFNVCAETEQLLMVAVRRTKELVEAARLELTGEKRAI